MDQRNQRATEIYPEYYRAQAPCYVKERQRGHVPFFGCELADQTGNVRLVDNGVMSEHHSCWKARRTAGVLHLNHVVRIEARLSLSQNFIRNAVSKRCDLRINQHSCLGSVSDQHNSFQSRKSHAVQAFVDG